MRLAGSRGGGGEGLWRVGTWVGLSAGILDRLKKKERHRPRRHVAFLRIVERTYWSLVRGSKIFLMP